MATATHAAKSSGIKQAWQQFKSAEPGNRFEDAYKRRQQASHSAWRKAAFVIVGVALMIAGIVLMPAPGPGSIVLILGAGLVAQESLYMARALDWSELRLRALASWALQFWRTASIVTRILLVLGGAAVAAAAAFATYKLMFGR